MIRNQLLLVLLAAGLSLLAGCAAVAPATSAASSLLSPSPPGQFTSQTITKLEKDNFELIRTNVSGHSKGFSLLGLITIWPATLTRALNQVYASAQLDLGRPQSLANVTIERSASYWILFGIPRVDVSADVVEFRPARTKTKKEGRPSKD